MRKNDESKQNNTPQIDLSTPNEGDWKQLTTFILKELLEGVTPENIHPEINTGQAVGKEFGANVTIK